MTSENKPAIAAVDLGNSKVKVLLNGEQKTFDYQEEWASSLIKLLVEEVQGHIAIGISSVRPEKLDELKKKAFLFPFIRIVNTFYDLPKITAGINTSGVQGFGADRIFGLYGALLHAHPPLFTVDCGTALTINFLDSNKTFRGGAILPGIGLQLKSLHEHTEQLPLLKPSMPQATLLHSIGTTTQAAMLAGVVGGVGGAVRSLIERMAREAALDSTPHVLLTGGDAEVLLPEFAEWAIPVRLYPQLVREGLADATRRILELEVP